MRGGRIELVSGAFRLVRYGRDKGRSYAIIANGEKPEKFWKVKDINRLERVPESAA